MLTKADVERLLTDSSVDTRAATAEAIASEFDGGQFTAKERELAEGIFRAMMQDAELRVRRALAENLKNSGLVPHDIALTLAKDVTEVATPILEFSQVLTDADLVEIISTADADKGVAIAKRETVSEEVSGALVDMGRKEVAATLLSNDGAEISENSLQTVLTEFGGSDDIQSRVANRGKVPVKVAEKLVNLASANLQQYLTTQYDLSSDLLADAVIQSRERATLSILGPNSKDGDIEVLVRQLNRNGRLTPTIILRALCMGDQAFFSAALAELVGIPVHNAELLIHDSGSLGLKSAFEKAGLPEGLYPAVRVAVDVLKETEYDGEPHDRERFTRRVLERILTQFEAMDSDDIDYLLGRLSRLAA